MWATWILVSKLIPMGNLVCEWELEHFTDLRIGFFLLTGGDRFWEVFGNRHLMGYFYSYNSLILREVWWESILIENLLKF